MQKWVWLIGVVIVIKLPILLTHHIQEDAFITWRVAQNLIDYGVLGFNGEVAISSSTTYLYTFFSAFFIGIFGSTSFIQPLLITNIALFTIALWFLAQLITPNRYERILLFLFLNFIPPSMKIAYMGMEYALLFALFVLFLWNAFKWRKAWLFILLPILILWTRLDAAIFLGLYFLYDVYLHKKINVPLIIGGVSALLSFTGFNYLYFGEWVLFSVIAANFDWYYWITQLFTGVAITLLVFDLCESQKKRIVALTLITIPLITYIIIHATATGNGEWNYRAEIGRYLDKLEPDKSQYIMLEPAGYIPYFSKLKTIDEVGLVFKGVNEEMLNDFDNWYYNSVIRFQPKYLLTLYPIGESGYYKMNAQQKQEIFCRYDLSKRFQIQNNLTSQNALLEYIYNLKPSGRDYYLYIQKNDSKR